MKKTILFLVFLFVSGMAVSGWAAVFNVSTPAEFQTALTTAETNGEDDTINVAAGIYNIASTLYYSLSAGEDNFALTIQGAGAGATILDGGGTRQIMSINTYGSGASAHITIRDMTFQNGYEADDYGGGLYVSTDAADITVENTAFDNNTAEEDDDMQGGGVYAISVSGTITFTNNTFSGNVAYRGGGAGISSYSGAVILTNNTFSGNDAYGGGVYVWLRYNTATADIYNNIIWGNIYDDLYIFDDYDRDGTGAVVNLFNNDYSSFGIGDGDNLSQGGNIDQDPLLDASFHLQAGSPAIDTGDNAAPSLPATDFEGDNRVIDGDNDGTATVDMGADEYEYTAPTSVPTMTQWGMIVFMALAGLAAVWAMRRGQSAKRSG